MLVAVLFGLVYCFTLMAPKTAHDAKEEVIGRFLGKPITEPKDTTTTKVVEKVDTLQKSDEYVTVPSNVQENIFYVVAEVNGVPIRFLLDTGCSDMQITSAEYYYLKHMGLACDSDLVDSVKCSYANGVEATCPTLRIKTLKIGDVEVNDMTCVIQEDVNAPLLLGQSILNKVGNVFIDFKDKTVKIKK